AEVPRALAVRRPVEDRADRLAYLRDARPAGLQVDAGAGPGDVRGHLRLLLGVTGDDERYPVREGGLHPAVPAVGDHDVRLRQQPAVRDERRRADVPRHRSEVAPARTGDDEDVLV